MSHEFGHPVVAEVAETSYVGMSEVGGLQRCRIAPGVFEAALVDLRPDLSVGLAERGAGESPAVDLLDSEEVGVQRVVQYVGVDLDVGQHVVCHLQAVVHQLQGREEYVLEQLVVTVVAVGQVAAEHGDLVLGGEYAVAFAAHHLPDVGVLLVRHGGGTIKSKKTV